MKKTLALVAVAMLFMASPKASDAHTYDRDDDIHPLRLVAYVLHPIGWALDRYIMRPIHEHVSQDQDEMQRWHGHDARERGADYPDHLEP